MQALKQGQHVGPKLPKNSSFLAHYFNFYAWKKICDFLVAKIEFLVTFKSHFFKKNDDYQNSKLKFLVTFNTQNKIFIVEFFLVIWAH